MASNPVGNFNEPLFPVSVKGIVVRDGKIHLRKNERMEWELPGGRIEETEQPTEALVREVKEELGFKVVAKRPILNKVLEVPNTVTPNVLVSVYLCEFIEDVGRLETDIVEDRDAEYGEFTFDELEALDMPELYKQALKEARQWL